MTYHAPQNCRANAATHCAGCATPKRALSVLRTVVTVTAIAYAGYSVYHQKLATFRDLMLAAKTAQHWIMERDKHEREITRALGGLIEERDALRANQVALFHRLKLMERAVRRCVPSRRRRAPKQTPRRQRQEWPWDVFKLPSN